MPRPLTFCTDGKKSRFCLAAQGSASVSEPHESAVALLAIVYAVKTFHHYLYGAKCTVESDHRALKYLFSSPQNNPRVARWALALQGADIEIRYKRGALHTNADALSRMPREEVEIQNEKAISSSIQNSEKGDC